MDIQNTVQQLLSDLVLALFAAALSAAIYAIRHVVQNLKATAGKEEMRLVETITSAAVQYAEQSGLKDRVVKTGQEKKVLALDFANLLLEKYGVKLTEAQLDGLIEKAVQEEFNWSKKLEAGVQTTELPVTTTGA